MSDVPEGNKVTRSEGRINIYLKQPKDFIYDIDDIVVEYNSAVNDVEIVSDSIPVFIKDNMKRFFKGDVKRYVRFLEENLEIFFKGEVPEIPKDQDGDSVEEQEQTSMEPKRPHELPKSY